MSSRSRADHVGTPANRGRRVRGDGRNVGRRGGDRFNPEGVRYGLPRPRRTADDIGTDTVFPTRQPDGWKLRTLKSLAEVEAFLDCLENNRVTETEMLILANDSFAVRWRSV